MDLDSPAGPETENHVVEVSLGYPSSANVGVFGKLSKRLEEVTAIKRSLLARISAFAEVIVIIPAASCPPAISLTAVPPPL